MKYINRNLLDNYNSQKIFEVKVIANAKLNRVKKEISNDGLIFYKVYVSAAPKCYKANIEIIKLLAENFCVAKSSVKIIHGLNSRIKIIKIE